MSLLCFQRNHLGGLLLPRGAPTAPTATSKTGGGGGGGPAAAASGKSNLDLLLDLQETPPGMPPPVLTPSLGGLLSPVGPPQPSVEVSVGQPMYTPTEGRELLNKLVTGGVQVDYRFTRQPHLYSGTMVAIELTFSNLAQEEVKEIKLGSAGLPPGLHLHEFPAFLGLGAGQRRSTTIGIDYNDTTQAARVDLVISGRVHSVSLSCPTGECTRPLVMPHLTFQEEQAKLRGMNESVASLSLPSAASDKKTVTERLYTVANMLQVPGSSPSQLQFAGQTVSGSSLVLLTLDLGPQPSITVNTEKIVLGSMLVKEVKAALERP